MNKHEIRKDMSRQLCRLFFSNVDYLRSKRGLNMAMLRDGIRSEGFSVSDKCVYRYLGRGKVDYFKADTFYLAAFAEFFGEPLGRMLSVDYKAEAVARGEVLPGKVGKRKSIK